MQNSGENKRLKNNTGIIISRLLKHEAAYAAMLLLLVLSVVFYELRLLNSQLIINRVADSEIDYEEFRRLKIGEKAVDRINSELEKILRSRPEYRGILYMDEIGYLTFSMMAAGYDLLNNEPVDKFTYKRAFSRLSGLDSFQELYRYYRAILSDAVVFPVPMMEEASVSYIDSWYGMRTYGGIRKHEGCDIMADNNQPGYFPVISITDGVVEKLGWLEQGGNRIGIRSGAGGYFYYAHLHSYADDLKIGDRVEAGQLLGFMGDSGYGPEGTTGKFKVHLHLGIYVDSDVSGTGELSVNPYYLLKLLEKSRTYLPYAGKGSG